MTKQKPKSKYFSPTEIPKFNRDLNIVVSCCLLLYGLLGLIFDDIYIPGRQTRGLHFHGPSMYIVFAAFLFTIAYLMALVVDHYDRRNNEKKYATLRKVLKILSYSLYFLAIIVDCLFYKQITRH